MSTITDPISGQSEPQQVKLDEEVVDIPVELIAQALESSPATSQDNQKGHCKAQKCKFKLAMIRTSWYRH